MATAPRVDVGSSTDSRAPGARGTRLDLVIGAALALVVAVATNALARRLVPRLADETAWDVWFGADSPRVFHDLLHRTLHRASLHPFFSLLTFPPLLAVRRVFSIGRADAVCGLIVTIAALWIAALYALFRLIGMRRMDATLFAVMAIISAAAMFWLPIAETYPLGSLTLVLALVVVALAERRAFRAPVWAGVIVLTLSVTVTNLVLGLLAAIVKQPWRRSVAAMALATLIAGLLWTAQQRAFIPERVPFTLAHEGYFIHPLQGVEQGLRYSKTLLCQPMVVSDVWSGARTWISNPAARAVWPNALSTSMWHRYAGPDDPDRPDLVASGTPWGGVAVAAWLALLALGAWSLLRFRGSARLRIVIGVGLVGQLAFYLMFGLLDSFLFTLNYLPLLLAVAAFATLTRARPLALALALVVTVTAGINNAIQLGHVLECFDHRCVVTRLAGADGSAPGQHIVASLR